MGSPTPSAISELGSACDNSSPGAGGEGKDALLETDDHEDADTEMREEDRDNEASVEEESDTDDEDCLLPVEYAGDGDAPMMGEADPQSGMIGDRTIVHAEREHPMQPQHVFAPARDAVAESVGVPLSHIAGARVGTSYQVDPTVKAHGSRDVVGSQMAVPGGSGGSEENWARDDSRSPGGTASELRQTTYSIANGDTPASEENQEPAGAGRYGMEDEDVMQVGHCSVPLATSAAILDADERARSALSGMRRGRARPLSPLKDAEKPLGRRGAKPEAGAFVKFARCRVEHTLSSAPQDSPMRAGQVRVTIKSLRGPTPVAAMPPRAAGVQKQGIASKAGLRVARRTEGAKSLAQVAHDLPPEVSLLLSHLERFRSVRAFSRAQFHVNLRARHTERLSMVLGLIPLPPRPDQPQPPPLPVYTPPLETVRSDQLFPLDTLEHAPHDGSWLASKVEPAASAAWSGMRPAPSSMLMPVAVRPSISQPRPTMGGALAFEPCLRFKGRRPGFAFKAGPLGLGYYWDAFGLGHLDMHAALRGGCF